MEDAPPTVPTERIELRRALGEAAENHDVAALCQLIPAAAESGADPQGVDNALRVLHYEARKALLGDIDSLRDQVGELAEQISQLASRVPETPSCAARPAEASSCSAWPTEVQPLAGQVAQLAEQVAELLAEQQNDRTSQTGPAPERLKLLVDEAVREATASIREELSSELARGPWEAAVGSVDAVVAEAMAVVAAVRAELREELAKEPQGAVPDAAAAEPKAEPEAESAAQLPGAPAGSDAPGGPGHKFRGVSVHYLANDLLQETAAAGLTRDAKVHEIEECVIRKKGASTVCPRDGRIGAAYVDCVSGEQNAGLATFMLSYTWGYTVGDIADTLLQLCQDTGSDPQSTYVWICCLCINQHRVKEAEAAGSVVPFSSFQSDFADRVIGIGQMVAMMSPWRDPQYIKRVWCDFEMYTATTSETPVGVKIAMPPREAQDFREALLDGGVGEVWSALAKVRIEHAEASVPEDREQILDLIKEGPGFHKLNSTVAERLQAWIVQACEGHLQQRMGDGLPRASVGLAQLGAGVGELLTQVGHLERAQRALEDAQRIRQEAGAMNSKEGANLLRALGVATAQAGDQDKALELFEEARRIRESVGALRTADGARLHSNIGTLKLKAGDAEGALAVFEEARSIREETDSLSTSEGALLEVMLGNAKLKLKNNQEALQHYEAARRIREDLDTLTTPDGARVLYNIGRVKGMKGRKDNQGALEAYKEARIILEKTATLETVDGVNVLTSLGDAHERMGKSELALDAYEVAKRIREMLQISDSEEGKQLLQAIRTIRSSSQPAKTGAPGQLAVKGRNKANRALDRQSCGPPA